jgi:hypothetical protein
MARCGITHQAGHENPQAAHHAQLAGFDRETLMKLFAKPASPELTADLIRTPEKGGGRGRGGALNGGTILLVLVLLLLVVAGRSPASQVQRRDPVLVCAIKQRQPTALPLSLPLSLTLTHTLTLTASIKFSL